MIKKFLEFGQEKNISFVLKQSAQNESINSQIDEKFSVNSNITPASEGNSLTHARVLLHAIIITRYY